jgi:hypothetical protein
MTAREATQELAHVILRVNTGGLGYDEGKALALPLLKIINERQAEIAKKFRRRPAPISFGYALRTGMTL